MKFSNQIPPCSSNIRGCSSHRQTRERNNFLPSFLLASFHSFYCLPLPSPSLRSSLTISIADCPLSCHRVFCLARRLLGESLALAALACRGMLHGYPSTCRLNPRILVKLFLSFQSLIFFSTPCFLHGTFFLQVALSLSSKLYTP